MLGQRIARLFRMTGGVGAHRPLAVRAAFGERTRLGRRRRDVPGRRLLLPGVLPAVAGLVLAAGAALADALWSALPGTAPGRAGALRFCNRVARLHGDVGKADLELRGRLRPAKPAGA